MPVLYDRQGHVVTLTLSRPAERNAWGPDFVEGLSEHLNEIEDDDDVRCVVLTGDRAGKAFCAGAYLKDPKTHSVASAADFLRSVPKRRSFAFDLLTRFPKPLIASVNGYAVGIGCLVTFCADLIVASDKAEWRLPQVALGILPAYGGGPRTARWIGKGLAMRLALGFPLEAEEAYRIGLAQWLVNDDALEAKTMEVAEHIAGLPPLAAQMAKESMNRGLDIPNLEDAALADLYRFMALELTEDKEEAHAAWRERRPPTVRGR
jgi:enoyl-CoA hydratase/carnithine racemase